MSGLLPGLELPPAPTPLPAWLAAYRPRSDAWDELFTPRGEVRPAWQPWLRAIAGNSAADWTAREGEISRWLSEHGVTYNVYSDTRGTTRPWELDPVPMIVPEDEFRTVSAGLEQRARLLNAIVRDLYGPQRLLREGWVPATLVFANPGFLRAAVGTECAGAPLGMLGTDLVRRPDGAWIVLADRTQAPSGKGYSLENRTVISSTFADAFAACRVQRLGSFFEHERDAVRDQAPARRQAPLVVLLTPGPYNETYFEHAFKARHLGFPSVEGADLTVRDRWVYLKTLEGLRRVDVIVRRVDDGFCDPLELRTEAWLGVAGLAEAWRAGHVTLVNWLGSGVVETPALQPFLPGLCRHLLGEDLLLNQVPTWWLGQADVRRRVLAEPERWVIKRAFKDTPMDPIFLGELPAASRAAVLAKVEAEPHAYVAQEPVALSTAPAWSGTALEPRRVVWRAFTLAEGGGFTVMPGGLSRVSPATENTIVTMQAGAVSKDTWVIAGTAAEAAAPPKPGRVIVRPPRSAGGVPSRLADHLFWMGRYAERLEHVVRLGRGAFRRLSAEGSVATEAELAAQAELVRAVKKLPPLPAAAPAPDSLWAELRRMFEDDDTADTVPALARRLRYNASAARDRLSDDMWRLVNTLAAHAARSPSSPAAATTALDRLVLDLAALAGMEAENMTRGHGWRFLEFGRRLERAVTVLELCREACRLAATHPAALVMLLEVCDSAMTYRRLHLAAPQLLPAVDLVLANESNPRSVAFQLHWISRQSAHLPPDVASGADFLEKAKADQIVSGLSSLNLQSFTSAEAEVAARAIAGFCDRHVVLVEELSDVITARYFSHALPHVR